MTSRYLSNYIRGHGGTALAFNGFCAQPHTLYDGDVAYCGGCGWVFAIQCCVPGCRRTRGNRKKDPLARGMTWLCADHWPLVPMWVKQVLFRARRRRDRLEAIGADPVAIDNAGAACARMWRRVMRIAIERSIGI